jgi:hypothetical protein
MKDFEAYEKGNLIKDAFHIVNDLAENDLADVDGEFNMDDFDWEELQDLIIKARELKKNRWWDVPKYHKRR